MKYATIIETKDGFYIKIEKGYTADTLQEAKELALENGIVIKNIKYTLLP